MRWKKGGEKIHRWLVGWRRNREMKGNTKERYGRREGGGRGVEKVEGGGVGEEEEEKRKKRRTIYIYIYIVWHRTNNRLQGIYSRTASG